MRLTEKKDSGHWCLRDVPWSDLKPGVVLSEKTWEKLYGALWKLKDYEDAGKSPDEIKSMDDDMQVTAKGMLKKVAELSAEIDRMKTEGFWIPVTEKPPEPETYILVSFENFTFPGIAAYKVDDDGSGAFYAGDEAYTYLSVGLFVNAWMPLPEPYKAGK